jgi:hypothetical protein
MKHSNTLFAAFAAAVIGLGGLSTAEAKTYSCVYAGTAVKRGQLPDRVDIVLNGSQAVVNDPIIQDLAPGPVTAKVHSSKTGEVLLTWSIRADFPEGELKLDFKLWLPLAGGKSGMTSEVLGYEPRFRASGTCKVTKG